MTGRWAGGQHGSNVVRELAHLFNPPLPDQLDIDTVNGLLADLLNRLNQQIPGIVPAPVPPAQLDPEQFLELTVPPLDLNLLGLGLETSSITVDAFAHEGSGQLLGNVLTTALNTLDATPENLTGLSNNLNSILAKVVGVLNAANLVLPADTLQFLPSILRQLASPTLVTPTSGATTEILNLVISNCDNAGPPVDVDLLGLGVSTSNIEAKLLATTGEGQILGNLHYNAANLLNPDGALTLLSLLTQLGNLTLPASAPELASIHRIEQPTDVNGDEQVTPRDALHVVNYLNEIGPGLAPVAEDEARVRILLDVSGDGVVTPIDALLIINYLNSTAEAEGEAAELITDFDFADSPAASARIVDDSLMAYLAAIDAGPQKRRQHTVTAQ